MARASLSNLSTFLTKLKSIFSLIGHTHSQYVQNTTYNNKISSLDSSVSTLSSGKVAKAGDTMTGVLRMTGDKICCTNDTSFVRIDGGTDYNNGGSILLTGKDFSGYSGRVTLTAKDGTNSSSMYIGADGTTSAPTPATTDNSTKIATTAFVNNASVKRYDITYTTATNQPWKAIASAFSDMPTGVCLCGVVANGTSFNYFGSKTTSSYGSFIIHSYTDSYMHHVWVYNGTWYYQAITCGSKTSFTV